MTQQREDIRHLMLAGTISFPSTFPKLGLLGLVDRPDLAEITAAPSSRYLTVTEDSSLSVTIKRWVAISEVKAVLVPRDPNHVRAEDGMWYFGNEIEQALTVCLRNGQRPLGIAYVAEATATLLEVRAGMTAAESAQYYPPITCDRTRNHYNPGSVVLAQQVPSHVGGNQAGNPAPTQRAFECDAFQRTRSPLRPLECDAYTTTRSSTPDVINPHDPHLAPYKNKTWQQQ